jgi:hypothetical protein
MAGLTALQSIRHPVSLTFAPGSIRAITSSGIVGSPSNSQASEPAELYFEYLSESTRERLIGVPLIHFESISFPFPAVYTLKVIGIDDSNQDFSDDIVFDATPFRGCAFSVRSIGNYTVFFESAVPAASGVLAHDEIGSFAADESSDNFYLAVHVLEPTPTVPTSRLRSPLPTSTDRFTVGFFPLSARVAPIFRPLNCLFLILPW